MSRGISAEFLKEIENTLRQYRRENHKLEVVRRLNDREMMTFAHPVYLWRERVHGLGFYGRGRESGSCDPSFNLEIWTCRGKAGYHFYGPCQQVETTRVTWSRFIHVEPATENDASLSSHREFDLRLERDKALQEILQHGRRISNFWQNEGAVVLIHLPSLHLSIWKEEREHQRFAMVRVQDKGGNHVDIVWCAPVAKKKDEDALVEEVLESINRSFGFGNWHQFNELGFTATCLGGGLLDIDYDKRKIVISGKSDKYGEEPDRSDMYHLIKRMWYPDYDVEIK